MFDVNAFQIVFNEILQALGPWLFFPMRVITFIGDEEFYVLMLPIFYWCFDQKIGVRVGIMLLLSNGFNTFFKFLFRTPRPSWFSDSVQGYVHESSFGLPSGHAQNAASIWGWLAVEVKQRWFTIAMLTLIFLIGFSRLVLGVHFLGDVLLGWLIGGLLVWALSALHKPVGQWVSAQSFGGKLALVAASSVGLMLLAFIARWLAGPWVMNPDWVVRAGDINPYALDGTFTLGGTWLGFLGGFVILSEKKGSFLAGEGGWQRLVRFLIGVTGVFILYFGLGQVFPREADVLSYSLRFLRYALIGLWIAWVSPILFEKINVLKFEKGVKSEKDVKFDGSGAELEYLED
jgi:membrane-associated phospholipid phosphatase